MKPEPRPGRRVTEVVVLTTAMLSFISFWRAAAIVLCDLASTVYYIGGIVEQAVGPAAPWFILAVMLFSYAIRAVYMESCSMFVRGGVYKVVREAMGETLAKVSAAALMFDYVLTGPISTVSAGQYLAGLLNTVFPHFRIGWHLEPAFFSVLFAIAATLYFWWENIKGIHESSDKALKIMQLTTVMGVVILLWCGATLWARGARLPPFELHFSPEALGWTKGWVRPIGAIGILIAFGHALLAMSGEESLAQVYRELEAPKIKNLERAGLIIFLFSLLLTSLVSFFAVMIIPDAVRISQYGDNLLSGLAMSVIGPHWARVLLQAFVVSVGVLILAGAANTSIVGANGVLNRLAEDGILVDWFRGLHRRFGTTHRLINLIVGLQLVTILLCRGDVYLLGEAYAFGVVWSFVFKTMAVMMLRFKRPGPREFMVPGNVRSGGYDWPVGLAGVFTILLATALMNFFTKTVATVSGLIFTAAFYGVFEFSERWNARRHASQESHHEKFNLRQAEDLSSVRADVDKPNRVLVAVRDPGNLYHLGRVLDSFDERNTDLVVFTSRIRKGLALVEEEDVSMEPDEQKLFTRVLEAAEKAGKTVTPMLVVSNEPFYAISQAAQAVGATEVVFGVSAKLSTDAQLERLAMTWGSLQTDKQPVRFRIIGPGVEHAVDL